MTEVVLVDEHDKAFGVQDKTEAHLGEGSLHRAFTTIVVNKKGEILIARRSAKKMLWPLTWDNSCASHPAKDETYMAAGERRLVEELGFSCHLEIADRFQYQEKYSDVGSENELCTTLIGEYNGEVHPNPDEVAEYRWMRVSDLLTDMTNNPNLYTKWFLIALSRLIEQGRIKQED